MNQDKTWLLQKIQVQGIVDDSVCTVGTQIFFTRMAPWIPVSELNEQDDIALNLVRHKEAWWITNHSDEWCCAVNEQIVEPHHRMRLNDGDVIEWGLSSWRLVRHDELLTPPSPKVPVSPFAPITEHLDLDWFKRRHANLDPQDLFDIIPVREANFISGIPETDNALLQLHKEYQQALLSPEKEIQRQADPFPRKEGVTTLDLTELCDTEVETGTLQDMVTGIISIDAVLDTLDATGDSETAWTATPPLPDILHLLSTERTAKHIHSAPLPDLTQREHRIIGIDSHYRITSPQKNRDTTHEKK